VVRVHLFLLLFLLLLFCSITWSQAAETRRLFSVRSCRLLVNVCLVDFALRTFLACCTGLLVSSAGECAPGVKGAFFALRQSSGIFGLLRFDRARLFGILRRSGWRC